MELLIWGSGAHGAPSLYAAEQNAEHLRDSLLQLAELSVIGLRDVLQAESNEQQDLELVRQALGNSYMPDVFAHVDAGMSFRDVGSNGNGAATNLAGDAEHLIAWEAPGDGVASLDQLDGDVPDIEVAKASNAHGAVLAIAASCQLAAGFEAPFNVDSYHSDADPNTGPQTRTQNPDL